MARGLNVFVNIGAKLSPTLGSSVSAVERKFSALGRRLMVQAAEVKASWKSTQKTLSEFGSRVSLPLMGVATIGAHAAYEWSKVGNELQAVSQMSGRARRGIEAIARSMPGNPADNLSMALDLARTGLSPLAIQGTLFTTMKLSRADNSLGPEEAASVMARAMNDMRMFNEKMSVAQVQAAASRVGNNLAFGSAKSPTDLRMLGESFKIAGPLASRLGMQIEDLTAYFMTMAKSGIRGSEAGVALRSALVRMLKPTKMATAVLERYNMKLSDYVTFTHKPTGKSIVDSLSAQGIAAEGVRSQIDALLANPNLSGGKLIEKISQAVSSGMKGGADAAALDKISDGVAEAITSGASRVDFAKFVDDAMRKGWTPGDLVRFFDQRQGARLATLFSTDFQRFRQALVSSLKVKAGQGSFLDKMYAMQMQGAVGPWQRLQQGFGNVFISMAESGVMDTIANGMNAFANSLMAISRFSPTVLKGITYSVLGLAAVGPVRYALGGVATGLKLIRTAALLSFKPIGMLWRVLFSPVGLLGPRVPFAARIGKWFLTGLRALRPLLMLGLRAVGGFLLEGLGLALEVFSGPVGWAILGASAAALAWTYRDKIIAAWHVVTDWFTNKAWPAVVATVKSIPWKSIGMSIADSLTFGLASKFAPFLSKLGGSVRSALQLDAPNVPHPRIKLPPRAPFYMPPSHPRGTPHRKNGGPIEAGKRYTVGEEGPEEFVSNQSGTIIPHEKTASAGDKHLHFTANINMHGNDNDPKAVAREVERVFRRMAREQSALLSD